MVLSGSPTASSVPVYERGCTRSVLVDESQVIDSFLFHDLWRFFYKRAATVIDVLRKRRSGFVLPARFTGKRNLAGKFRELDSHERCAGFI